MKWYKGVVQPGSKLGRTIGFPTINLDPSIITDASFEKGVHACIVKIADIVYRGALYYGPRLVKGESKDVLEIYVLDFKEEIYGSEVMFRPHTFIRSPEHFENITKLMRAIEEDVAITRKSIPNNLLDKHK